MVVNLTAAAATWAVADLTGSVVSSVPITKAKPDRKTTMYALRGKVSSVNDSLGLEEPCRAP